MQIAGLKKETEKGMEISTFVSGLLKEVQSLEDKLLVDCAHRVSHKHPGDTEPPRSLSVTSLFPLSSSSL